MNHGYPSERRRKGSGESHGKNSHCEDPVPVVAQGAQSYYEQEERETFGVLHLKHWKGGPHC